MKEEGDNPVGSNGEDEREVEVGNEGDERLDGRESI